MFLKSRNMTYARIDGSQTPGQRNQNLLTYQKEPDIKILLMTTGTGAFGYVVGEKA